MSLGRAFRTVSLGVSLGSLFVAASALSGCDNAVVGIPDPVDSGALTVACTSAGCDCPDGRTCVMNCAKGQPCNAQCGKGSTCTIDCAEATDCSARCLENSKGTVRRQTGSSPIVTSAPGGDCKVCLGECRK